MASHNNTPNTITALATRIAAQAAILERTIHTEGLKYPSFDQDADEEFPSVDDDSSSCVLEDARAQLLEDTRALHDLILGPAEVLRRSIDTAVQRVIYHYKIHEAVPLGPEGISYTDLASRTGLPAQRLQSVIRQSALNRVFEEVELKPEHDNDHEVGNNDPVYGVRHTASSALLLRDSAMQDWYGHCVEEMFPAAAKLADAWDKYPCPAGSNTGEPEQSAFGLAFDTPDSVFRFYEKHPDRQARFFGAMDAVGRDKGHRLEHVVNGYDWAGLGRRTVVDVGGSSGFVSIALARAFSNLSFIVQDYQHTIEQGRAQLPADLEERIRFVAHDFFSPQPVATEEGVNADVFLLRHICHNWSRRNAVRILRNLVPAMERNKATSRIVLVEVVVLPAGSAQRKSDLQERYMRNINIAMLAMLNTQERSAEDWQAVVEEADPRLAVLSINQPRGSWDSIIEIGFREK
ncbi:hypothetical protein VTN96DRAFT_7730 [Rasamsonia emersonii]